MKKIFASILLILSAAAGWRACLPARRFHESLALVFVVAAKPAHGLTAFVAALRRAAKDRRVCLLAGVGGFSGVEHPPRPAQRLAGGGVVRPPRPGPRSAAGRAPRRGAPGWLGWEAARSGSGWPGDAPWSGAACPGAQHRRRSVAAPASAQ